MTVLAAVSFSSETPRCIWFILGFLRCSYLGLNKLCILLLEGGLIRLLSCVSDLFLVIIAVRLALRWV